MNTEVAGFEPVTDPNCRYNSSFSTYSTILYIGAKYSTKNLGLGSPACATILLRGSKQNLLHRKGNFYSLKVHYQH